MYLKWSSMAGTRIAGDPISVDLQRRTPKTMRLSRLLAVLLFLVACAPACAQGPTVFAAASLTDAFREIGKLYQAKYGAAPTFSFGATNELRMQLEHGARADVFASASAEEMDTLVKAGMARAPAVFARNRLVLVVPKGNPAQIHALRDLARANVKLVTSHPNVPVGKYTARLLAALAADATYGEGFRTSVEKNVVSHEPNVRQVLAKVTLGEADAAIVYDSDVSGKTSDSVTRIEIPAQYNQVASYPLAALEAAPAAEAAAHFVELVLSADGQAALTRLRFLPAK